MSLAVSAAAFRCPDTVTAFKAVDYDMRNKKTAVASNGAAIIASSPAFGPARGLAFEWQEPAAISIAKRLQGGGCIPFADRRNDHLHRHDFSATGGEKMRAMFGR